MKQLFNNLWNSDQSWHWESLLVINPEGKSRILKVNIRQNAYKDQSYQQVHLFDGDKWNLLVSQPIDKEFESVSYVQKTLSPQQKAIFTKVENSMLKIASLILDNHTSR